MIDASMAVALIMPDEDAPEALAVATELAKSRAAAPSLWRLEVANTLIVAERRKRITALQRAKGLANLGQLPVEVDEQTSNYAWTRITDLAIELNITAYDASYIELAIRKALPISTLDRDMRRAAKKAGIDLLRV